MDPADTNGLAIKIEFYVYKGWMCLAKLPYETPLEAIPSGTGFFSVTKTREEISVVAEEPFTFPGVEISRSWRCVQLKGPLDMGLTGILASLLSPLASANVSCFAISTYDTDYIFVKQHHLDDAVAALQAAGHVLLPNPL